MAFHPSDPSRPQASGQAGVEGGHERVARALARAGVASRRDAERLIEAGRVALNGEVLTSPAVNVAPGDILTLDGVPVAEPEPVRIWRHHKPSGLLTSHKDPKGRKTVFEALPKAMGRVISVGRLDFNTEGLLLLTNDGGLARELELPANGWVRRYRARAFGRASPGRLAALKNGVTIEGVHYGPIEAEMEKSGGGSNIWVTVAIQEGKNREVRRVLEHLGLKVNRLIRIGYGPFELGDLEVGAVAEVPPRVIREKLAGLAESVHLPKGDRKLFNWKPEAAKPASQRRAGPSAGATLIERPGRAPSGGREKAHRRKDEAGKPKPAYKAGWARPKPKAKPPAKAPTGPKRSPGKPKGRS
jgi:23S rRNA pseudouridine2605 synthase